jgi:hypothetical protein
MRILIILLAMAFGSAQAATIIFESRDSFKVALGQNVVDDYTNEGYAEGDYSHSETHDAHSDAHMSAVIGETDYFALNGNNHVSSSGTEFGRPIHYCAGCNIGFKLSFTTTSVGSSSGVYGVGVNISDSYDMISYQYPFPEGTTGQTIYVEFGDGTLANYITAPTVWGGTTERELPEIYWGITSDKLIKSIRVEMYDGYQSSGIFVINELTIGASVVPIPAAAWLFGSALLGLGWMRRKA